MEKNTVHYREAPATQGAAKRSTIIKQTLMALSLSETSRAIIEDGDRKSWDPRAPMIWDKFSILRTNCPILTTYIRADPRTCRGLSRECCHVA